MNIFTPVTIRTWEVFGENRDYVIDPEECMADNFAYALTFVLLTCLIVPDQTA